MKKIAAIFLFPLCLMAQPTPAGGPPPATQTEVDAGLVANKYVSPLTLNNWSGSGGGAVSSVFGRTGVVEAEAGDYSSFYLSQTGVNTVEGSWIFTPDLVTIAANAGTVDITKVHSIATNGANTTLTPSAAGINGQQIAVLFVNSDTAAHTVTGAGSASTISYTAAASSTTVTYWRSNGSAWSIVGGPPTINDMTPVTSAEGDGVPLWDISAGVPGQSTISGIVSFNGALGTDDTYKGNTITGLTAGATIAQWEAVYVGGSSTYLLADANGSGTYPSVGLAVAAYSSTNAAVVLVRGTVRNDAWNWTPGGRIYLSATPGALTQTAPSASGDKVQDVGFALTADIAYFDFNGVYVTVQ